MAMLLVRLYDMLILNIIQLTVTISRFLVCTVLQPHINQAFASACKPEMTIPNEPVGFDGPLTDLPGCNPLWVGTGAKPTCNPPKTNPGFVSVKTPLPAGWAEVGCTVEGTTGRALTGASTTSPTMTKAVCANFCASGGFPYAGVEYGDECYCGKSFSNGANSNTVGWQDCSTTCAGNRELFESRPQAILILTIVLQATRTAVAPTASPSSTTPASTNGFLQSLDEEQKVDRNELDKRYFWSLCSCLKHLS